MNQKASDISILYCEPFFLGLEDQQRRRACREFLTIDIMYKSTVYMIFFYLPNHFIRLFDLFLHSFDFLTLAILLPRPLSRFSSIERPHPLLELWVGPRIREIISRLLFPEDPVLLSNPRLFWRQG